MSYRILESLAMDRPFFCITSDLDWASDFCIRDFLSILNKYRIKPTLFATHESPLLTQLINDGLIEIGIHPNFFATSTQGRDYIDIIDNLLKWYPTAKSFRAHSFFDNSRISVEMQKRGISYDSNLCLFLQPDIGPLTMGVGGVRYPVFWEDDCHYSNSTYTHNFSDYQPAFTTPGLKILNFHPFLVAANVPNSEFYEQNKLHIKTLTEHDIEAVRYKGKGTRTFLIEFMEALSSSERFYTLSELKDFFPGSRYVLGPDKAQGRTTVATDDDYNRYWNSTEEERQAYVKGIYEKRNALDIYATSRDFNLRELEVELIRRQIDAKGEGTILDIGCGNGYTLICLASEFASYEMLGVDFSENLINGARRLLSDRKAKMRTVVRFLHADAVKFLRSAKDKSVDYVITERFIQNLPSEAVQSEVLGLIHKVLKPNGKFLMCEGGENGFKELNKVRERVGLDTVEATSKDNISAIRMKDATFEDFAQAQIGFRLEGKYGFSDYFLISRVVHPLFVAPEKPRFDSRINELARRVQLNSAFNAGLGSNTLWVMKRVL